MHPFLFLHRKTSTWMMDLLKEEPLRKSKSFTSAICSSLLFWSSSRPSSSPSPSLLDTQTHHQRLELGLKGALPSSSDEEQHNRCCINRSKMLSSPPFPASSSPLEEEEEVGGYKYKRGHRTRSGGVRRKREFPPPIPLLARTENLPCHMPWVLKRYYKSDGRLILQEERVKHHEYFRAHRANGRLTLQLVNLDDNVSLLPLQVVDATEKQPDSLDDDDHDHEKEADGVDEVKNGNDGKKDELDDDDDEEEEEEEKEKDTAHKVDQMVLEESTMILASSMPESLMWIGNKGGGGGGGGGKCSTVRRRSNSDLFRMPIPFIRPVYS